MCQGICVIIEPRKHQALKFVVSSIRAAIPNWTICVVHGRRNGLWARHELLDIADVTFINMERSNLTFPQYNRMLTSADFYRQFNSEYILLFQTDSMLFAHSGFRIEDFLGWDYIGAPWSWNTRTRGGNGGLSLRRVATMIRICSEDPYPRQTNLNEDLYFSRQQSLTFPSRDICSRFSVESVPYHSPFGCHKPWKHLNIEQWLNLQQYAPCLQDLVQLNLCSKSDELA